jgi:hypothetical protein
MQLKRSAPGKGAALAPWRGEKAGHLPIESKIEQSCRKPIVLGHRVKEVEIVVKRRQLWSLSDPTIKM